MRGAGGAGFLTGANTTPGSVAAGWYHSAVVRAGKQIDPSLILWKRGLHRLADARSDLRARRSIHGPGVPERIVYRSHRSGWYYLQVRLAKPGFGPYRLKLVP